MSGLSIQRSLNLSTQNRAVLRTQSKVIPSHLRGFPTDSVRFGQQMQSQGTRSIPYEMLNEGRRVAMGGLLTILVLAHLTPIAPAAIAVDIVGLGIGTIGEIFHQLSK